MPTTTTSTFEEAGIFPFSGDTFVGGQTAPTKRLNPRGASELETDFKNLMARFDALDAQITGNVQAPHLDVNALNRRALDIAKTKVNPYFDKERNLFAKDMKRRRSHAVKDFELLKQEADVLLSEFLEDTQIGRTRTAEDVEGNLNELGISEELFQESEAATADQERTSVADQIADAGLTTSGIGQQKIAELQRQRNRSSQEAVRQIDAKKAEQQKFKTRTFSDFERGDTRKKAATKREKAALKLDIDKKLGDLAFEFVSTNRARAKARKAELARQQRTEASNLFAGYLDTLGSEEREASERTFGGRFG